ncbi:MAG: hypothetical protein ACOCUI_03235 [bacterium]
MNITNDSIILFEKLNISDEFFTNEYSEDSSKVNPYLLTGIKKIIKLSKCKNIILTKIEKQNKFAAGNTIIQPYEPVIYKITKIYAVQDENDDDNTQIIQVVDEDEDGEPDYTIVTTYNENGYIVYHGIYNGDPWGLWDSGAEIGTINN